MDYEDYMHPMLDHEDYTKCGSCWQQKLLADVAKEFKESNRPFKLGEMYAEMGKRWRETSLFKEVNGMFRQGLKIDEVSRIMARKGIEI